MYHLTGRISLKNLWISQDISRGSEQIHIKQIVILKMEYLFISSVVNIGSSGDFVAEQFLGEDMWVLFCQPGICRKIHGISKSD